MIKLYRRDSGGLLRYHEAWSDGGQITEHWGVVGELGETRTHHRRDGLECVLADARAQGFAEFGSGQAVWMEVQYDLDGRWGNADDLDLRNAIMAHLDEVLGWTGLGHCDGGSIGSGAMEVACVVVDAGIAQRVIGAALDGSRFPRFSRINVR
ncbi:hypothetical protein ACPPVO_32890 [Dactylosporangium sp. McL0621]|uniref:hypothetical protein n=1 Tax=Dactylosporangium sp. McL0621 TaxID=3415678 RepID=UPI003CEF8F26